MANNEGLLELNGKDIVQVIGEEAVPRTGDIDATTYNQKNYALSGSSYTITKDSPDVLYLELTGDFAFTCQSDADTNRAIKVQVHKAATVEGTATITYSGVTQWLTDANTAPVFGQVASAEQNLILVICLSNGVVLGNTLYNSENPVSGGSVTVDSVEGLTEKLDQYVPRAGDIDAVTYNQKNHTVSETSCTINKDSPDVMYVELTSAFTVNCTGAENANRTIKIHFHKSADVATATAITWNGVTEWLTDGDTTPVFGQVTAAEQNLVVAICLSNTVVLGNTLYNSENGVTGGAVTISGVIGLQEDLDDKINLSGSRGQLAGYEDCSTVTSLTLTDTSADSNYYNSTAAITVNDGTAGKSWTKTVKLAQVPSTVNMTGNWTWVGGSAPTMVANGLLVFTWQNSHGLINFLSPSA